MIQTTNLSPHPQIPNLKSGLLRAYKLFEVGERKIHLIILNVPLTKWGILLQYFLLAFATLFSFTFPMLSMGEVCWRRAWFAQIYNALAIRRHLANMLSKNNWKNRSKNRYQCVSLFQDRIGLKKMKNDGKLHFLLLNGDHLQIPDSVFVSEIIEKFLKWASLIQNLFLNKGMIKFKSVR